jgi:RNA recognition motif-containing protein
MQKAVEIEKKALEREMRILERLDKPDLDLETIKSTLGMVKEDTIYVSNLPFSCTERDVFELFNDCGTILSIRIPENRQTKQNRGFAFVTFDSEKAARRGLNYDGHKYIDRKLRVSKAEKREDIENDRREAARGAPEEDSKRQRAPERRHHRDEERREERHQRRRSPEEKRKRRSRSRSHSQERRRRDVRKHHQREERHRRRRSPSEESS